MTDLSANIKLRPTRIGFLVRPSDISSIRRIMRLNACLWGGLYNPIIPVCGSSLPKDWKNDRYAFKKGMEITKGYIRFFEPDVYVEAEEGLLEKSGLEAFRENVSFREQVTTLSEFMSNEYRGKNDPTFGQNIFDILKKNYETERRFVLRDEHPAIAASGIGDVFAELCMGVYPKDQNIKYLLQGYEDVYTPEFVKSNVETWIKIYSDKLITPLRVTDKYIDKQRFWHHEPIIFLFDPKKSTDVIDLWNLRIEPSPVFPVPIGWFDELANFLKEMIEHNYRPLKGNPNGVMHNITVEIARSISEEKAKSLLIPAFKDLPQGSWDFKLWRNPVWDAPFNGRHGPRYERMSITCSESRIRLPVKEEDGLRTEFSTLSPDFAERYSGSKSRWANIFTPSGYLYSDYEIATVLPHNTFDRSWPRLGMGGEKVNICRDGWVFLQDHKDWEQPVCLMKNDDALSQWFEKHKITGKLSEPGNIAKQMLGSLKGFWGLRLINDPDSLHFINRLANKRKRYERSKKAEENRIDGNTEITEDGFDNKAASIQHWKGFLGKHNNNSVPEFTLSDYIERNVMKLGIETKCTHCGVKNWHKIDAADYILHCERCLKNYDFPQDGLRDHNENWKYRVVGPFAVPNYAEGSYGALLTIKALSDVPHRDKAINFSTAMNLESNGEKCEIDFALWLANESNHDTYGDPQLIIGEAKSFGENVIKEKDISQLKLAAGMLPASVLVISILKDNFSEKEKVLLKELVEWARESDNYSPKHWVILLTGTEIFAQHDLENAWKEKGEPHSKFADSYRTDSLSALSDTTIEIYLGLSSYHSRFRE